MKRRLRLGPTQSPVVSSTLDRRYTETRAASAVRWGAVCLLLSLPLLLDLYLHVLSYYSGLGLAAVWYTEVCVLAILLLSGLYDCVFFSRVSFSHPQVKLTPAQKNLLRVAEGSGVGCYETVTTPTPFGTPLPQPTSSASHSHISPLALLTPTRHPVTPRSSHVTPHSGHSTPALSTTSSPHSGGRVISSQEVLESYLRSEGEREQQLTHSSPDLGWPATRHTPDQPSSLRKYHVATRTQSPASDGGSGLLVNEDQAVWTELGISRGKLVQWTENCRRWIAETVVGPVATEIAKINKALSKGASPVVSIGTASLSALKRECKTKGPQVPTLHLVLPYLELTTKQGYLVHRINELAIGGSLSVYRWNGGGTWKGVAWSPDLPSDPQIVLHLLCTYLDSHLPLSPLSSDGRPFTSQYLLKHPDKPVAKSSEVVLYQASLSPPHYNILVGQKMVEIPKGRNNLFHAVVALLHHLKPRQGSTPGSVAATMASLQMLWIVE